jgi:serine/threonine protein kinase
MRAVAELRAPLQGIMEEDVYLPEHRISGDASDFIMRCLQKDARKRPCIQDLLQHAWIQVSAAQLPCECHASKASIFHVCKSFQQAGFG